MQTGSRRLTSFFMPIARENPREAEIASHRLMIRSGMIRQEAQGSFSWLPLGKRVLEKVCNIIREEQNKAGAQEILMPTVQSADLWRKSGRYDVYGKEMLRIQDRHERDLLYGPTNEEMATDIFSSFIKSYKDLPLNLYQIQWKYRDEIRPRFGVMRSREFLMKDAYSFDIDSENARKSYNRMFVSYLRIFQRMGLKAVPMRADTGPIGGDLSHEFIILAETGESEVFCQKDFLFLSSPFDEEVDFSNDHRITAIVDEWTQPYAATKEMHNTRLWENILKEEQLCARGIEVGHIFYFGEKYSRAMNAKIAGSDGKEHYVHMGSYGIGPSRLVGALIEANHDEKGIVFPENLAPFDYVLVNIKESDLNCREMCEKIFLFLQSCGKDVLYDDTTQSAGSKLATADLIGIPWQIIVSPRNLNEERVELKNRKTGLSEHISFDRLKTMCGIVE